jgi:hypothetical protein
MQRQEGWHHKKFLPNCLMDDLQFLCPLYHRDFGGVNLETTNVARATYSSFFDKNQK